MQSGDGEFSKNFINHLVEILKNMKPQESGWVLRELALDISFDRELFKVLCTSFYSPKYLKTEVSEEDLQVIVKKLPKELVVYLYDNFVDYRNIIKYIYDDKKLLQAKDKSLNEDFVVHNLISVVLDLYEKRQISYNGILLIFFTTKCNSGMIGSSKGRIYFIKRQFIPGELIWIFISSPINAGKSAKVLLEYSDLKTKSYSEINLDFLGEYWGWIPVEHIQGTTFVTVQVDSEIITQDRIQIAKESSSLLYIKDFFLFKNGDIYLGSGFLLHKYKKIKDGTKIRYSVYCDICSSPIYFNTCELIENRINIKIEVPKDTDHQYERFRIFIWMEADSLFFLTSPTNKSKDYLKIQTLDSRNSGEKVLISENFNYGQRYFLFISKYESLHNEIFSSFYGEWGMDFWGEIDKKQGGIDYSVKQEEIKLFTEEGKQLRVVSFFYANYDGKIDFSPEGDENISDLYISLYSYENGWADIGYYLSPLNTEFQIYIDLNKYNQGEESRTYLFNNDNNINISVLQPRPTKKDKHFPSLYLKYNEFVKVKFLDKTQIIYPKYQINPFNKYLLSGTDKGEELEIMREIEDRVWKSKELNPELIIFRMYLLNKYSFDNQYKKLYFKLNLSLLQSFIDSEDRYHSKSTKDRKIYSIIIEHILLYLLEKVVDTDIQLLLSSYFKNIDWQNKKRCSNLESDLITNTYKYLQFDSGEIRLIQEEFTLYELLILLYSIHKKYKKDLFEILLKRKNIYKKKDSYGIRKIFERFGFVEPRKKKYTKIYLTNLSINQIIELMNYGFYPLKIRDYIQTYLFIEGQVAERIHFISRLEYNLELFQSSRSIKINKYNFKLGELGTVVLENTSSKNEIYIEFPSFLNVIKNSGLYEINNRIYIERNNSISSINLQAKNVGRGYIHVLEVNSQGNFFQYQIGLIESVYQ